jgi:hypothetical protein
MLIEQLLQILSQNLLTVAQKGKNILTILLLQTAINILYEIGQFF